MMWIALLVYYFAFFSICGSTFSLYLNKIHQFNWYFIKTDNYLLITLTVKMCVKESTLYTSYWILVIKCPLYTFIIFVTLASYNYKGNVVFNFSDAYVKFLHWCWCFELMVKFLCWYSWMWSRCITIHSSFLQL